MFLREISVDGRGIGLNNFKGNFFHAHIVYQLKNEFPSTQYLASRLWNNAFTWCREKMLLLKAVFIRFLWHKCNWKEQRGFRSINCSSTVNEKFHLYFTDTLLLMSGKQHVLLWISLLLPQCIFGLSSKRKYFRIAVNLTC